MASITKLAVAGALLLVGANGAALPKSDAEANIICFPSTNIGWTGASTTQIESAIDDFCSVSKYGFGSNLPINGVDAYNYNIPEGVMSISVLNSACPQGMWIDDEGCGTALHELSHSCWNSAGYNVGGGYTDPCGDWFLEFNRPGQVARQIEAVPEVESVDVRDESSLDGGPKEPTVDQLECFAKGVPWPPAAEKGITDFISNFCSAYSIPATVTSIFSDFETILNGNITASVSNIHCPGGLIVDGVDCQNNLMGIYNGCTFDDGSNSGGGTSVTENSCGNWILQYGSPYEFTATKTVAPPLPTTVPTKRAAEKRCSQWCYDSATSSCFPPNWDTCTDAEKACLVQYASDDEACLKAGNCTPDC